MENNTQQLMKHFATVLRNRALGKETDTLMNKNLVFYFTRKELIEMVKKHFGGTIPKEHNLLELENRELLELIDNEIFIISYVTEKWSKEPLQKETPKTANTPVKTEANKSTQNKKKNDTVSK